MLLVASSLHELSFPKLMEVYAESNRENGEDRYPGESPDRQLALAEEGFRDYLSQVFFTTENARYFILVEAGRYVSALRLEPYEDGLLLEALETAPEFRKKGYAAALIEKTQAYLKEQGSIRLYSHVSRSNIASLRTHEKRGFRQILDYGRYIDGSINRRTVTLLYTTE